jgi:hypothetical protein
LEANELKEGTAAIGDPLPWTRSVVDVPCGGRNELHLAPEIQEEILFLPEVEEGRDPVSERSLRRLPGVMWERAGGDLESVTGTAAFSRCLIRDSGNRFSPQRPLYAKNKCALAAARWNHVPPTYGSRGIRGTETNLR